MMSRVAGVPLAAVCMTHWHVDALLLNYPSLHYGLNGQADQANCILDGQVGCQLTPGRMFLSKQVLDLHYWRHNTI